LFRGEGHVETFTPSEAHNGQAQCTHILGRCGAIALALGGAGWLIAWTGIDVSVQLASPRWVVGRTLSIYYALSAGGMAAGSWIWGSVAQNYSLTWALEGASGALLLVAAAGIVLPVRPWEETDQESSDFRAPKLALDLKPGPIVAKVNYSISEKNIDAFLGCMRATLPAVPVHETGRSNETFRRLHFGQRHSARQPGWTFFV
jgi:hypothetical protein